MLPQTFQQLLYLDGFVVIGAAKKSFGFVTFLIHRIGWIPKIP